MFIIAGGAASDEVGSLRLTLNQFLYTDVVCRKTHAVIGCALESMRHAECLCNQLATVLFIGGLMRMWSDCIHRAFRRFSQRPRFGP